MLRLMALFSAYRDIKPDNIFISRNATPKVADFGFAKTETILPENQASKSGCVVQMRRYQLRADCCGDPS